jgi:hypothetical protein
MHPTGPELDRRMTAQAETDWRQPEDPETFVRSF